MENEIVVTVKGVLWFCGAIGILGGAITVIAKCFAPFRDLKKEVAKKVSQCDFDTLKQTVETLKNYQITDHKELQKVEIGIEKICKCTLAITDHELTGNSVDKLREAKDEMQDYLIQK